MFNVDKLKLADDSLGLWSSSTIMVIYLKSRVNYYYQSKVQMEKIQRDLSHFVLNSFKKDPKFIVVTYLLNIWSSICYCDFGEYFGFIIGYKYK